MLVEVIAIKQEISNKHWIHLTATTSLLPTKKIQIKLFLGLVSLLAAKALKLSLNRKLYECEKGKIHF